MAVVTRDPYEYLSPSGFELWEQCPRRWRAQYVDMEPGAAGVAALVGSFVHAVFEVVFSGAARTVGDARDVASSLFGGWLAGLGDVDRGAVDGVGVMEFKRRVWPLVAALWRVCDPARVDVSACEVGLKEPVGGVPFRGFVDLVADGKIVDFKTGGTPARFRWQKDRQVQLYVAGLEAKTGVRVSGGETWWLADGTVRVVDVSAGAVGGTVDEFRRVWGEIHEARDTGVWREEPGPLCAWCPAVGECESGRREVAGRWEAGRVRADAPAVEVLGLR